MIQFYGESESTSLHLVNRSRSRAPDGEIVFGGLYDKSLASTRGDPIFNIHSYATKIDPVAVLACILAHTEPGDTVFDGFSGSGTTAVASLLAQAPGDSRLTKIKQQISAFKIGPRGCHAFDVSGLAWYIGDTLVNLPDVRTCLLYTSDAADDSLRVDLGGRRIIKKVGGRECGGPTT